VLRLITKFIVELRQPATAIKCEDSVSDLLFNIVALGRYIGPCLSKYTQTTQDKVNYHTYLSGTIVIKAFIANNFIFYNNTKQIIKELNKDSLQRAPFFKLPGRDKRTTGTANQLPSQQRVINLKYAPCAVQLVLRARQLNQPDDMPIVLYKN
jgi:hypothetical protein